MLKRAAAEIAFEASLSGYFNVSSVVAMTGLCDATIWKRAKLLGVNYEVVKHNAYFSEEAVDIIGNYNQNGCGACYSERGLFITTGKLAEHVKSIGRRQINKLGKDGRWPRFIMSGMVWNSAQGFSDYLIGQLHPVAAMQLRRDIKLSCPVTDDPTTSVHHVSSHQILIAASQSNDEGNEDESHPAPLFWLDY